MTEIVNDKDPVETLNELMGAGYEWPDARGYVVDTHGLSEEEATHLDGYGHEDFPTYWIW